MTETNPLFDGTLEVMIGTLDVTAVLLPGLSWSTTAPGGFGDATMCLPASSPWGAYHAQVVKGAAVTMHHSGTPVVLFEGVVTNDCTHAVIAGGDAYYEVTAAGRWWIAGQRQDYVRGWCDEDITQWFIHASAELTSRSSFEVSVDGRIDMGIDGTVDDPGRVTGNKGVAVMYWLNNGLETSADEYIDHIECLCDVDVGSGLWYCDIDYATSAYPASWTNSRQWNSEDVPAWTAYRTPSAGASLPTTTKAVRFRLYRSTTGVVDHDRHARFKKIRVYIGDTTRRHNSAIATVSAANPTVVTTTPDHNLTTGDIVFIDAVAGEVTSPAGGVQGYYTATRTGAKTFTIPVNVTTAGTGGTVCAPLRVEEIMGQAATATGLATTATVSALAGAPNGQPDAMARPFTTIASFIDELASRSNAPVEYGFWDSADFAVNTRTAPAGADAGRYLIDATTPGIDYDVFANTEDSYDYVRIVYKFVDVVDGTSNLPEGTPKTTYAYRAGASPTDPGWAHADHRVYLYDAGDMSLTDANASAVATQLLAYLSSIVYQGTITIATPTVPLYGGGTKNTCYIRAGDWVAETHHYATSGLLYISSCDIDADSGVASLTIGQDREFVPRVRPYLSPPAGHRDGPRLPSGRPAR